jgi:predicted metal-dependent phosphoesterase TrpH
VDVIVELHCHSTCSDGSLSPEAVGKKACERGVDLFALTDHDTTAGSEVASAAYGGRKLRAVELSCHYHGRPVHLLVFDTSPNAEAWAAMEKCLASVAGSRAARLRQMGERLQKLGVPVDVEAVIENAGTRTVGRPDLAQALLAAGWVTSLADAYSRFLHDHGPAMVPLTQLSVADALACAEHAGACVSLAHPHTVARATELILEFAGRGLGAIEAFYGGYDEVARKPWLDLAEAKQLAVTGGSDYHGAATPKVTELGVELPTPWSDRLLSWLA